MLLKNKLLFDLSERVVVALDGPAASGKGTIGKLLAEKFHLKYFESGFLYRYLAFKCQELEIPLENTEEIIELSKTVKFCDLNNFIGSEEIGNLASQISVIPEVRHNINQQLKIAINENPRVIMEGRDIGSNVAPKADLKIFIIANLKSRAERRFNQLIKLGKECIMSELLVKLKERDKRDQERKDSPLKAADDALIIDTSDLTPDMVVQKVLDYI